MEELRLPFAMIKRVGELYATMESAYKNVAAQLTLSCHGCPDNCCDSYFLHHTYLEWCYLWIGLSELPDSKQQELVDRAARYVVEAEKVLQTREHPQIMCPLNENGLCIVYKHRLMICRTHGVPAVITRPDGKTLEFPGCFRCQQIRGGERDSLFVERTPMLRQLASMENELLHNRRHMYPRVKLTIAEMIVKGRPRLLASSCGSPKT